MGFASPPPRRPASRRLRAGAARCPSAARSTDGSCRGGRRGWFRPAPESSERWQSRAARWARRGRAAADRQWSCKRSPARPRSSGCSRRPPGHWRRRNPRRRMRARCRLRTRTSRRPRGSWDCRRPARRCTLASIRRTDARCRRRSAPRLRPLRRRTRCVDRPGRAGKPSPGRAGSSRRRPRRCPARPRRGRTARDRAPARRRTPRGTPRRAPGTRSPLRAGRSRCSHRPTTAACRRRDLLRARARVRELRQNRCRCRCSDRTRRCRRTA
jgi:hypothetical protein